MISVAIVDDHPVYRQGLAMAIEHADDFELVGEASSIEAFDALGTRPDVVLLDLHLPGIEGSAGVAHVCSMHPCVLVVSAAGTPEAVVDAVAAGAVGYLTKEADADEITRAVRVVAGGATYVSPTLASFLLRADRAAATSALTNREREVLELVSQGLSNKLIARRLQISEHTVKFHISSISTKLGASSRTDAVSRGIRRGLITL